MFHNQQNVHNRYIKTHSIYADNNVHINKSMMLKMIWLHYNIVCGRMLYRYMDA